MERLTPSEWGAANIVYKADTGHPGPRDPYLTPYVVAPSLAVHGRTHKRVVFVCCAQTGKTESIRDVIGARLDASPVPTMYVAPTKDALKRQIEPKIADLLLETPLRRKVALGKRWTKLLKIVSGVPLRLAYGGSSQELKTTSYGLVVTDEADELLQNVKQQGNPIPHIDRRGDTYPDFVHYVTSTPSIGPSDVDVDQESGLYFWAEIDPTEIESTIWRLWQSGTRYHWAWPCPHCGEYFIPRFSLLKWDKPQLPDGREGKSDPVLASQTAHMDCPCCGAEITDEHKEEMNARGVYVAPGQTVTPDGEVHGDPPDAWTLSYWVSGLASPFVSWGERAAQYVDAVRSGESAEVQTVINGSFGELFAPGSGEVPEWRELERLKCQTAPWRLGEVPAGVKFLTLAADVQINRIIWAVRGWGPRSTSWLVDLGEVWGNTADEGVWDEFGNVIQGEWGGMPLRLVLVDSGFRPGNPKLVPEHRVYSFCQRHHRIARPTKGRPSLAGRPVLPKKIDARINWRGRLQMVGIELLHVDTDYVKRVVHERLRWPIDEPGAFLLPEDVPDFYLQQLVSEARVRKPGGKPTWVRRSRENHFFDVEAMQVAAGWHLGAQRIAEQAARRHDRGGNTGGSGAPALPQGRSRLADYAAQLNG